MEFNKKPRPNISRSRAVLKYGIFAAAIFVFAILQTSFFSRVRLFSATPDITLALVMGLGVFDDERTGAALGIWGGVAVDALGGAPIWLSPIFYMLAAYLAGIAVKTLLGPNLPSWAVICFAGCAVRSFLSLLLTAMTSGVSDLSFSVALLRIVLPEFASSYPLSLFICLPAKLLCKLFRKTTDLS